MYRTIGAFVILGVIQVLSLDEHTVDERHIPIDPSIPHACYGPPDEVNLFDCCPVAPLFTEDELKSCGLKSPVWRFDDCKSRICTFKNHNFLNDDETINYAVMGPFLDKWAENQTHILDGLAKAKEICFGKKNGPPIPQRPFSIQQIPCEVDKLLICIRSNIIWNCKHNENYSGCKKLAVHLAECRQYLFKEIPTE